MKNKLIVLFLLFCLGFGYFGSQKLGATKTIILGSTLILVGAILEVCQPKLKIQRFKK